MYHRLLVEMSNGQVGHQALTVEPGPRDSLGDKVCDEPHLGLLQYLCPGGFKGNLKRNRTLEGGLELG